MSLPMIHVLPDHERRLRAGSPWIYSNEIKPEPSLRSLEPGALVKVAFADGKAYGLAHYNPHSLIAARVLTRSRDVEIGPAFFERRFARALSLRALQFDEPYYRLAHGEADGLPGLIVDRYGETVVAQVNTAGMDKAQEAWLTALDRVLSPERIVFRGDAPVRTLEGLPEDVRVVKGPEDSPTFAVEDGRRFVVDPIGGQKTGWFYDQRANHAFAARFARGRDVLDVYSYGGGFGLAAAAAGARSVLLVDRSQAALDNAAASAALQGVNASCTFQRTDAYAALDGLKKDGRKFGLVICDPPAFVKSKKDLKPGLKGYRKLAHAGASVVADQGFFAISCCSHNVDAEAFLSEVWAGIRDAGRGGRVLHRAGANSDHPIHPALVETVYLKFIVWVLD
ncbi:MAG TPA: class I SAM-dependent rRNA methyltransferase [Geminicoccus sp.]|uniref:class I SAM-dependent rRNA methyltransferase n=1 Tax=Geminicoccus sp. TaxID=2024832 RepID=UPI002E33B187|nr:class I SAM-dependent rRNA methyltransferase [Geminicoccus sp.]HEX2524712.1 class I SAM-dependent rRNA methyltransferase [Geminicoccus sp.]